MREIKIFYKASIYLQDSSGKMVLDTATSGVVKINELIENSTQPEWEDVYIKLIKKLKNDYKTDNVLIEQFNPLPNY